MLISLFLWHPHPHMHVHTCTHTHTHTNIPPPLFVPVCPFVSLCPGLCLLPASVCLTPLGVREMRLQRQGAHGYQGACYHTGKVAIFSEHICLKLEVPEASFCVFSLSHWNIFNSTGFVCPSETYQIKWLCVQTGHHNCTVCVQIGHNNCPVCFQIGHDCLVCSDWSWRLHCVFRLVITTALCLDWSRQLGARTGVPCWRQVPPVSVWWQDPAHLGSTQQTQPQDSAGPLPFCYFAG